MRLRREIRQRRLVLACALPWLAIALLLLSSCTEQSGLTKVGAYTGSYRGNYFYDVCVRGSSALLTDNHGAVVLDITDPTNPRETARLELGYSSFAVDASDGYLYVGGGAGLVIASFSEENSPVIVGEFETSGDLYDILVRPPYAFLADLDGWFEVVNVSDPSAPSKVSRLECQGSCRGLAIAGNTLYLSDFDAGLQIIDIADPTSPRVLETMPDTAGVSRLHADRELLAARILDQHVKLFDISTLTSPQLICTINAEYGANLVLTDNEQRPPSDASDPPAAVAPEGAMRLLGIRNGKRGVSAYDVQDPWNPRLLGYYPIRGGCHGIDYSEGHLLAAMHKLLILKPDGES